jgi:tryptophan synthase alpha chain
MASPELKRVFETIRSRGSPGIIPFVTVGFPDMQTTLELVPALVEAGADIVELGVPFSDPLADGPTIQHSSYQALQNGVTLEKCIEISSILRGQGVIVPLVLMGYYNPILSYGISRFAREAGKAGVNGIIVPDLPPEESGPLRDECNKSTIDMVYLLAPTSTNERIAMACAKASGFIYCVSVTGVTGARDELPEGAGQLVDRIRKYTDLPIAVGFGISRRLHIEAVAKYADAAVVGSALGNVIDSVSTDRVVSKASEFIASLAGRPNHGESRV